MWEVGAIGGKDKYIHGFRSWKVKLLLQKSIRQDSKPKIQVLMEWALQRVRFNDLMQLQRCRSKGSNPTLFAPTTDRDYILRTFVQIIVK